MRHLWLFQMIQNQISLWNFIFPVSSKKGIWTPKNHLYKSSFQTDDYWIPKRYLRAFERCTYHSWAKCVEDLGWKMLKIFEHCFFFRIFQPRFLAHFVKIARVAYTSFEGPQSIFGNSEIISLKSWIQKMICLSLSMALSPKIEFQSLGTSKNEEFFPD